LLGEIDDMKRKIVQTTGAIASILLATAFGFGQQAAPADVNASGDGDTTTRVSALVDRPGFDRL